MTIRKIVLLAAVAACTIIPAGLQAQPTNTDPSLQAQLQQLALQVRSKAQAGKHTEADFSDELKTLDTLIASKKDAKTDEAVQLTYMKAMLYLEVIQDFDKGGAVMRQITNDYPNTQYSESASNILQNIAQQAAAKKTQDSLVAGATFPDFTETDLNGQPLSIASRKGKVVLVDFWATWCPPCRAELPNVIATYQKHHAQGFEVIGVSLDEDRGTLDKFLKEEEGMSWPQYFDGQRWSNKLAVKYGVEAIPFAVLIGPDGKIIAKNLRGEELEDAVAKAVVAK
jgi:thiol-disulfide isomerase/thioredoxin